VSSDQSRMLGPGYSELCGCGTGRA
jgi:hypothetical protein